MPLASLGYQLPEVYSLLRNCNSLQSVICLLLNFDEVTNSEWFDNHQLGSYFDLYLHKFWNYFLPISWDVFVCELNILTGNYSISWVFLRRENFISHTFRLCSRLSWTAFGSKPFRFFLNLFSILPEIWSFVKIVFRTSEKLTTCFQISWESENYSPSFLSLVYHRGWFLSRVIS